MNVDLFLLIFVLAVIAGAVYANIRLLWYFQAPEDTGLSKSLICKAIVVTSLTLCWMVTLLLPVDVRNSRPVPGVVDMRTIWCLAFGCIAGFLVIVVPGAMFYHEVADDDAVNKKRRHVLCNLFFMLLIISALVGISYAFLSKAAIPVQQYRCPDDRWLDASETVSPLQLSEKVCSSAENAHLHFNVGFQVYMIAAMCFIGWFFFVTFGGIGLSALPIDLILSYVDRPKSIDEMTYQQEKRECGNESRELLGRAEELTAEDTTLTGQTGWRARRKKKALQVKYNKFKRDVFELEEKWERTQLSKFQKGESLAVSIVKLVAGIIFAIMSIMWILHVILAVLVRQAVPDKPISFLNGLFEAFESPGLYPVGVAIFASFNLYLLACVVKGCLKFGMRIFFFFSIHPMRYQATPLNSILFNVLMVLMSSATVVQFSQQAFSDYARLTDADVIFAAQIKYLAFYSFFFENNVFIYTLLTWFLLTLIYLLVKGPRDHKRGKKKKSKSKSKEKPEKPKKSDKGGTKQPQKPGANNT